MIVLVLSFCVYRVIALAGIKVGWEGIQLHPSQESEVEEEMTVTVTETAMEAQNLMSMNIESTLTIMNTITSSLTETTFLSDTLAASPSPSSLSIDGIGSKSGLNQDQSSGKSSRVCPSLNQSMFQLSRSTWWKCKGHVVICFNKMIESCRSNLASDTCNSGSCYMPHLPFHIKTLERLAIQYKHYQEQHGDIDNSKLSNDLNFNSNANSTNNDSMSGEGNTGKTIDSKCKRALFTDYMELLANIIVQKSRFCHLDFDILTHLSTLVEKMFLRERKCLSGMVDTYPPPSPISPSPSSSTMGENRMTGGGTIVSGANGVPNAYFPEESDNGNGNTNGNISTHYGMNDYNQHLDGIMTKLQQLTSIMNSSNNANNTNNANNSTIMTPVS